MELYDLSDPTRLSHANAETSPHHTWPRIPAQAAANGFSTGPANRTYSTVTAIHQKLSCLWVLISVSAPGIDSRRVGPNPGTIDITTEISAESLDATFSNLHCDTNSDGCRVAEVIEEKKFWLRQFDLN
jgi:hypothetical protein